MQFVSTPEKQWKIKLWDFCRYFTNEKGYLVSLDEFRYLDILIFREFKNGK